MVGWNTIQVETRQSSEIEGKLELVKTRLDGVTQHKIERNKIVNSVRTNRY